MVSGFLTIFSGARGSPESLYLSGSALGQLDGVLSILVLCLLYWLAMVVVRWNRVARGTRELLRAEINSVQAELDIASSNSDVKDTNRAQKISGLLTSAQGLVDTGGEKWHQKGANFLFWSRGQEITGWSYVHQAEIQMTPLLDPEKVRARLETNEQQLRTSTAPPSLALADAIHAERRKALLAEALNFNYQSEDNTFSDLVSWQNKTSWLVVCGLLAVLVLSIAIPDHSLLFLIGATGGLLSRLSRSLDRKDVPTDYGASLDDTVSQPSGRCVGCVGWNFDCESCGTAQRSRIGG
jgi:hypothetical protein